MNHPRAIPIATTILLTAGLLGSAVTPATAAPTAAMAQQGTFGAQLKANTGATAVSESTFTNGGFESAGAGWTFAGNGGIASNSPHSGAKLAYLDGGASNSLTQRYTVNAAGNFAAAAWIASERAGGTFGIRTSGGEMLAQVDIPANGSYKRYSLAPVRIDANTQLEVFFTGGAGWLNIDDVEMARARTVADFAIAGQQGDAVLDENDHTIALQMPYETDLSALSAAATLPPGSSISPDPAQPRDYRAPVSFTVTDAAGSAVVWTAAVATEPKSITIDSSYAPLVEAFNWSKAKARSYVQTGKNGPINVNGGTAGPERVDYVPSYWAGYAHRTAFYSRDFVHQANGAHLAGLDAENKSMIKLFAGTANESRKWYPLWALNFDGSTYTIDYKSDTNFVREVPAVFELVSKANEQYRWTGDADYLNDPVLWQYYTKAVTDFIALHDSVIPNGVAEGTGKGIFQGSASYDERGGEVVVESGDSIGSQYQAFLAYADMAQAKGDTAIAQQFAQKAKDLQKLFSTSWGVEHGVSEYIRGRNPDNKAFTGFGREPSVFLALKELPDPNSKKTYDFLDYLNEMYKVDGPPNVESLSYVPDALFNYGENEEAWGWMKQIIETRNEPHEVRAQGLNGDYPEVSYTLLSQTVEGLAGVSPNAAKHEVSTLSHLPREIGSLSLNHIQMGQHELGVSHEGTTRTVVRHETGPQPLTWKVQFDGGFPMVKVDNKPVKPTYEYVNGRAVTQVEITVPVGAAMTVETLGKDNPNIHGDTILTHPEDFTLKSPAEAAVGVDTQQAKFTWSKSTNASEYELVVAKSPAMVDVVSRTTVSGLKATVSGLDPARDYYWEVTAVNTSTGQRLVVPGGTQRFHTSSTAVPTAPQNVHAYRNGAQVGLSWKTSSETITSTVYRAPAGTQDFTLLAGGLTSGMYLDKTAAGGPFTYRVTSSNERGESSATTVTEEAIPDGGEEVFLSDRDWVSAVSGWQSVVKDRAVSGGALRINGTTYAKGLGAHANSEIVYALKPTDRTFKATVGIDDAQRTSQYSSITFQVIGDGQVLFDSGVMRAAPYSTPQDVSVDVFGVEKLVLRVTDAGDGNNSDHADWANARILQLPQG
ncbi:NPCBM/NEW2 domain-containing protein [Arthrobacter sp. 35W]|uniref:NPCBM/NEW2 domain-containing protein n=1 Tax=Arthrobacter sp. 35W TaxID=1132441 RepID=UPI000412770A|nr:NPCBM/NEW2 domain-containing protein [Arthrobacter sp. 35W]